MAEETWHAARLIPTSGINGAEEQERRGTSALLAVLSAVREFGRTITQPLGAPAGTIETFIEVPFDLAERKLYPDGLIRVSRGKKQWVALVEVKTGKNELVVEQLESYLDIAKEQGFDALLTISNQISPSPTEHPVAVDKRKLRKVEMHHLSWTEVLTEAVMQKVYRGVADPDQAWVLGELIRYLEHPRSGAMEFDDMGEEWVAVRDAVEHGTLRATDKGLTKVVSRWDQLTRYTALRLGRELGVEVQPVLPRKGSPNDRPQALARALVEKGALDAQLRIPDAVGPITIDADFRAQRVSCSVTIDAPREGRPLTRVNWLLRQVSEAAGGVRVDSFVVNGRNVFSSELLSELRTNPASLVVDPKREFRAFRLVLTGPMGSKRGTGRGSFIGSVLSLVDAFYGSVVQGIKPWAPAPPKLRTVSPQEDAVEQGVPTSLVSTALSSQDGQADTALDRGVDDEAGGTQPRIVDEPDALHEAVMPAAPSPQE
ncbi:MAG: hypothetical protein JWM89_1748 [Acidimicrobiales bacterium]|nr:hypothetical protein [Acidimicrobiales bacterium]